ncbi:MAG: hypothetical protein AAF636_19335 [Pseudomonadota bacterium]
MTEETYGGFNVPKNVRRNPGGLLTVAEITEAVAWPGADKTKLANLLRWYVRQGYMFAFAKEAEGRKSYLFLPDQVLVADVLLRMREFGVAHGEGDPKAPSNPTFTVWQAFSVWKTDLDYPGDKPPHVSPGMMVIEEYEQGQRDWTFELWSFLNPKTGEVRFESRLAANVRKLGTDLYNRLNGDQSARAVFAIDLIDVLDRIHPRNKAKREAMN